MLDEMIHKSTGVSYDNEEKRNEELLNIIADKVYKVLPKEKRSDCVKRIQEKQNTVSSYKDWCRLELSKYKKVDCGGRWMNNIGYVVSDKRKFQSEYKFSIAFENEAYRPDYEWYVTEKIMEPMTVNSIPIYKGGSKVSEDFNSKSFVNYHDFNNVKEFIEYIIELDKNDDGYMRVIMEPWIENQFEYMDIKQKLIRIINGK
jgi:hypothetical protein